ncbi:YfgM family protein [Dongshaea marina]|uniref:YfgM family protein n=1 Tax=Dongshaea marina TaxID=2047966 RepID=UPI00131F0A20|nr:tetratricopeptide repeat protein [Dongshaea marina]
MDIHSTEEQQIEALKAWWSEYGKAIIGGVILAIILVSGWRYYKHHQVVSMQESSAAYTQVIASLKTQGEKAYGSVDSFIQEHKSDSYGALAAMALANSAVEKGKLVVAQDALEKVLKHSDSDLMKTAAGLRLARIDAAQGKTEEALKQLSTLKASGYQAQIHELQGDLYLKQGLKDKARTAYQQAANEGGLESSSVLRLKMDDLAQPAVAQVTSGEADAK